LILGVFYKKSLVKTGTTPLLIEIQSEYDIDENDLLNFSPDELNQYLDGLTTKEKKRIKERIRYRKNNSSSKHHSLRKEIIQNLTLDKIVNQSDFEGLKK